MYLFFLLQFCAPPVEFSAGNTAGNHVALRDSEIQKHFLWSYHIGGCRNQLQLKCPFFIFCCTSCYSFC